MVSSQAMNSLVLCLLLLAVLTEFRRGRAQDECAAVRCNKNGPEIRCPFRLVQMQPEHCGCPGFDVSCATNNETMLELPSKAKVQVDRIDYKSRVIDINFTDGCYCEQLSHLNLSVCPLQFMDGAPYNFTFFNCSSAVIRSDVMYPYPCVSSSYYKVYAVLTSTPIYDLTLTFCTKMVTILSDSNGKPPYSLSWSVPLPMNCQERGTKHHAKGLSKILIASGVLLGVLVAILAGRHLRTKEKKGRDIRRFLDDYRALKPTRYSYGDIQRITSQFKDKLGQGGYGSVFKGKLSSEILVAVKMLDKFKGDGGDFINEVGTIGRIHHVNVVRLVGFCADGLKGALVYEYLPNGSLDRFINPRNSEHNSIGWEKLQEIALGIARGIEYLHQGCDQRILHFDIKPHNILLDNAFNPKISDFGLAKLCSREKSAVTMTMARGTPGYIAPEVFSRNFGHVSNKSDIYSFGMLLLDMVGARKSSNIAIPISSEKYFPDWIYDRMNQGEDLGIWNEDDNVEIAKKLTIIGLWCIQWYPVDRPSMKSVIQMLEGNLNNLSMPPKPFPSTDPEETYMTIHTGSSSSRSQIAVSSESKSLQQIKCL